MNETSNIETVWAVPYIEVEFGQRPFGWRCWSKGNYAQMISQLRDASRNGYSGEGYLGPENPIRIHEVPFDCLEEGCQIAIRQSGFCATSDYWRPKFKSESIYLNDFKP